MRKRARMQPWVPLEVRRRVRAYCVTHNVTESALATDALVQYMDGDSVDEELVARRLDGLTQAVGKIQHDLDVQGGAVNAKTPLLNPGQTAKLTVKLPAGTYALFCTVPGHRAAGMLAKLTVH